MRLFDIVNIHLQYGNSKYCPNKLKQLCEPIDSQIAITITDVPWLKELSMWQSDKVYRAMQKHLA